MSSRNFPWISGATLMKKYGLQPVEVFMMIKEGNLAAYKLVPPIPGLVSRYPGAVKPERAFVLEIGLNDIEELLFRKSMVKKTLGFDEGETLKKGPKKALDDEVLEIIKDCKPELEQLWSAVKSSGRLSGLKPASDSVLMRGALDAYENGQFQFVEKEFLIDKQLFAFNFGNEKRDFVGRVLKQVVFKRTRQNIGYQKLFQIFNKVVI